MGYKIQDRLEIGVFINDKEYPLGNTNVLDVLHITATVVGKLPTLFMRISDVEHVMDTIGLQDGIRIRITLKVFDSQSTTFYFRKFNHKREFNGDFYTYAIDGYWDAPLYWGKTTSSSYSGSSNDVLEQIAKATGLEYDGTSTNDVQVWQQQNKVLSNFAQDVCNNGYVDEKSCMCLAVDLGGVMRYKNVSIKNEPVARIRGYTLSETEYTAVDVKVVSNSGFSNVLTGYNNLRMTQSLADDDLHTETSNLDWAYDSKSPDYNNALKKKLERGQVRFGPISVGNVHPNYERAAYQNVRFRNLFSVNVEILLMQPVPLKLFDTIVLTLQNESTKQDNPTSGNYLITGFALFFQGGTFAEKILLSRHGDNSNYVEG